MEGWVDLGSLIAARLGIEPTTTWLQVRRPNRYATESPKDFKHPNDLFQTYSTSFYHATQLLWILSNTDVPVDYQLFWNSSNLKDLLC